MGNRFDTDVFRRVVPPVVLALVTAGMAACGGGVPQESGGTELPDGPGAIAGRIAFSGTPPPRPAITVSSDPNCVVDGDRILSETLVVGPDGGLQNVFVYVKEGLGDRRYATPAEPVVLDQLGCRYTPHVFGVQVGQPVQILNSDPTLHNVHTTTKTSNNFNFGQFGGGPPSTRVFKEPEVMVPFRCDVHGWMYAYAGVLTHPFFAVTGEDGRFRIAGLPPGTYTIEAWHERLGAQTHTVTITDADAAANVELAFAEQG